jgi:hypothetical protein
VSAWTSRLIILGAALFLFGWTLVALDSAASDGATAAWDMGTLMVMVAYPVFVIAAAVEVTGRLKRRLSR